MNPPRKSAQWPLGGGEMGQRIRDLDWAATPLGAQEHWPQSLRTALSICLSSAFPTAIYWGPELRLFYNDSWTPVPADRHPWALGRPAAEVWSDIWEVVGPQFDQVLVTGDGFSTFDQLLLMTRHGRRTETYWNYSFTPIPDDQGGVGGVFNQGHEVTDRVLGERRSRFLLDLSDRLRELSDPQAIIDTAQEALGRHLGANRVGYGEVEETARYFTTERNWTDGTVPSRAGTHDLAGFGPEILSALRSGVPLLVPDVASDPRTNSPEALAAFDAIDTRAAITTSLVKNGRMKAALYVHAREPRPWTDRDAALVTDVADRTWDAVERARAEAQVRASEERFRAIVETAQDYAIFTTDTDGRIVTWPPGAEAVFGWSAGEAVGQPDAVTFTPEDRDRGQPQAERQDALDKGQSPNIRWKQRKDGSRVFIEGATRPLTGPDGRLTGFVKVGQDMTARRRAEEQLHLAAEAAELAIFDVDLTTGAITWDARLRGFWGVEPERVITDDVFIAGVHPEDRVRVRAAVEQAFDPAGDGRYLAEFRNLSPHGDGERWIAARGRVHFDGPRPVRLIGTVQDFTERKRAEAALHELNETLEQRVAEALAERKLLADVFERTDAMMSVIGPDLRLLAFNRAYAEEVERLGGRRPVVGERVTDIYVDNPELAAAAEANWTRAVAGEVFSIIQELGDPSRHRRSYERRFEPLYDREGRLVAAYQFATDVTERLRDQQRIAQAEAARNEMNARYRAYFENSGEGLFVVGVLPDGGFTLEEVNPAHRAALGFDMAAVPGRRLEDVLPPEVAQALAANYRRAVETGEVQRYRESAEIGGRVIHAETVLVPVRDETGRIVRIVGSGRDMTAQVQAEEALRQSQKMEAMGQLTGGVAHDFNNLLTPIVAVLDRLQRQGLGAEREQRLIAGAAQSADRARTLVQRLLAFARRQPLQATAVDVSELVKGMADLVASTIGPQIRVVVEAPEDLPPAEVDPNQLEMALLNLAVNARDAMPEGGTLRVTATDAVLEPHNEAGLLPGGYIRLSVADTGIGMDEATLARAVEPFFSTKGVGKGTGLGLSMVHGLASQLGGALTIQSRPGFGTNVELWLPQSPSAPDVAKPRDPAGPPSEEAGTVLLVDDDDLVRLSTADMLNELGYLVIEAASAEEARELLNERTRIDLLVTDHLMPGMTGTELVRQVRASRPGLPALVISGYAEMDDIEPDLPRLTKPFRKDELAVSLANSITARNAP